MSYVQRRDSGTSRGASRALTPERLMRLGNLWLAACLALAAWFLVRPLLTAGGPPARVASASPSAGAASLELTPASLEPAGAERVYRYRAIEDLRVGQRVLSDNPDVAAADKLGCATRVDPATWRRVRLYGEERWPDGTLDTIHIDTLQPLEWFELTGASVGSLVPPPLDLQEMGLSEELRAEVVSIDACPPLQPPLSGTDPGRLVLTTVNHLNSDVWELSATPVRGPPGSADDQAAETVTLEPTGFHKFYSETRSAWVSTNELEPGEIIRGRGGPLQVTRAWPQPGVQRVYNLTVEGEHVYYVSRLGLLAHNQDCAKNARLLRKHLGYEGRVVDQGQAAGHIVASAGSKGPFEAAVRSREILSTYGVNINDAANGIPVGHPRPHNVTHTADFNTMVANRLEQLVAAQKAAGRGRKAIRTAIRRELRKIGNEVLQANPS